MRIQQLSPSGNIPVARWGQASVVVEGKVYIFGGSATKCRNDLYCYDPDVNSWKLLSTNGTTPSERFGASLVAFGSKFYLFGGCKGNNKYLNDLYFFETKTNTWTKVHLNKRMAPDPRCHLVMFVVGRRLVTIGGIGSNHKCYNEVFEFDTELLQWTKIEPKGPSLQPRSGHCAVQSGDEITIFGGTDGRTFFNDVWVLDTLTWQWSVPKVRGIPPSGRFGHNSVLKDHYMYITGGCDSNSHFMNDLHCLNIKTLEWIPNTKLSGSTYSGRYRHTFLQLKDQAFLFGGTGPGVLFNDCFLLDTRDDGNSEDNPEFLMDVEKLTIEDSNSPFMQKLRRVEAEKEVLAVNLKKEKKHRKKLEKEKNKLQQTLNDSKAKLDDAYKKIALLEQQLRDFEMGTPSQTMTIERVAEKTSIKRYYPDKDFNSHIEREISASPPYKKMLVDKQVLEFAPEDRKIAEQLLSSNVLFPHEAPMFAAVCGGRGSLEFASLLEMFKPRDAENLVSEGKENVTAQMLTHAPAVSSSEESRDKWISELKRRMTEMRLRVENSLKTHGGNYGGLKKLQDDMSDTYLTVLRMVASEVEKNLQGNIPCPYALFVCGAVGRGEATLYPEIEYGITVLNKDQNAVQSFTTYSEMFAAILQEIGIEVSEKNAAPHWTLPGKRWEKDYRGEYYYKDDEQKLKRGSIRLIDTAENFSNWQSMRDVSGVASIAAMLREAVFVGGSRFLFDELNRLTWEKLDNIPQARMEFYLAGLASVRQDLYKLPCRDHIEGALVMNNFPLSYDLNDLVKILGMLISGLALVQNIRSTNPHQIINSLKHDVSSESMKKIVCNLEIYYEFGMTLLLMSQVHYKRSYHKISGMQVLHKPLKKYKAKFLEQKMLDDNEDMETASIFTRANVEWYYKILFSIKSRLLENPMKCQSVESKILDLYSVLFPPGTDKVTSNTIPEVEQRLQYLVSILDENKYFIAKDSNATQLRTKPLSRTQLNSLIKKVQNVKQRAELVWNEFYVDNGPIHSFETIESELKELLEDIDSRTPEVSNPMLLTSSQVVQLNNCVAFIKEVLPLLRTEWTKK